MSTAPVPALPVKTIATHVAVPIIMGVVMALCYLGGFHNPDPQGLRVDVIGSGPQVAVAAQGLQDTLGDHVAVRTVESSDIARNAIERREIAAAYAPFESTPQLFVSTAAGDPTAVVVERIFTEVTLARDQPLRIVDVVPAHPARDPSGQAIFFFLVALTVAAYGTGIAIAVAGAGRSIGVRLGFAVVATIVVAVAINLIATLGFDALPGARWQIFGLSIPYVLATMMFAIGLHPLISRFTTLAMVTVFVGLNFTTCGGVYPPALQPEFFGVLHDFWIGAGFNEGARDLAYFPAVGVGGEIAKVLGWLVASAVLVAVAGAVERRRATQPSPGGPAVASTGRHERIERDTELSAEQSAELDEDVVV